MQRRSKLEVYQEFIVRSQFDVNQLGSYAVITDDDKELAEFQPALESKDALVAAFNTLKAAIKNNQEGDTDKKFIELETALQNFKKNDLALSDETKKKLHIPRMAAFDHPGSLEDLLITFRRELENTRQEVKKDNSPPDFPIEARKFAESMSDATRYAIGSENYVSTVLGTNPRQDIQQKVILKQVLSSLVAIKKGAPKVDILALSKQISNINEKTLQTISRNSNLPEVQRIELLKIFLAIELLPYMQTKTKEVQAEKDSFFTTVAHLFQPKTTSEKKEDAITKLFDYFTKSGSQDNFTEDDVYSLQEEESRVRNIISKYSLIGVLPPSIGKGFERPSP